MNYIEFKNSLCRAIWIPDAMLTIEANIDKVVNPHKHMLFIDDEWGAIEAPGCDLCLEWETIEDLANKGKWESYQENNATIMVVCGVKYRIKFHRLTSLEELL